MRSSHFYFLAMGAIISIACQPKEKVVTETQTVFVEKEVPVYINCSADPNQAGCSTTVTSNDKTAGVGSNGGTGTSTTVVNSDAATVVTMAGSLALASGDVAPSMSLVTVDAYYLKCVTLDLDNISSCMAEVGSDYAFSLTCDRFKGKPFGCFILQGASGTTEDDALSIIGTLTSADLFIGEETTDLAIAISFDPSTGAAGIEAMSQKIVKEDGLEVPVDSSGIDKQLPAILTNLDIESGRYDMCFQPIVDPDDALRGKVSAHTEGQCNGFMETNYLAFQSASINQAPTLELWRGKADFDGCHDALGDIRYQISDGTNSLSFSPQNADYRQLLSAIVTNNWAPGAAIDQYRAAQAASSQKQASGMADALRTVFSLTANAEVCPSLIDSLVQGYGTARVMEELGKKRCDPSSIVYSPAALNNLLANDGPPPEWCDQYRLAPDQEARNREKSRFLGECKAHVDNVAGEDIWAGQSLVWGFLENLAQTRHQNSSQRGEELQAAYKKFDESVRLANCDGSGGVEFPAGIDGITNDNKLQLDTCAVLDDSMRALAKVWKDMEWDFQVRDGLKCIESTANLGSLARTACPNLAFSPESAVTVREFFRKIFIDLRNPFCSNCNGGMQIANGRAFLQEQVCFANGNNELDLTGVNSTGKVIIGAFMDQLVLNMQDHNWRWDSMPTIAQKKASWQNLIDGLITNLQVSGCGALSLKRTKTEILTFSEEMLGENPADRNLMMVGHTFNEFLVNSDLNGIDTKNPNGVNGDPLDSQLAEEQAQVKATTQLPALAEEIAVVAGKYPLRFLWMFSEVCRMVDHSVVAGWTIPMGANADVSCATPVPAELRQMVWTCQQNPDPNAVCNFPAYDNNMQWKSKDRYANLVRMINEERGRNAFRSDPVYKATKEQIIAQSQCLPDASLGHSPIVDGDGNLSFEVKVRAPVRRKLSGPISLDVTTLGSGMAKFAVDSASLQTENGGMGSESCYWGEVQKFHKLSYDAANKKLTGVFTQAWVDTCRGGDSSAQHAWHNSVSSVRLPD